MGPLSESIRNKAFRQTPLTSYFKPMLSHITVLPNTDEVPIPTTELQQSEPQQSVPKKSVPKKGKNKKGQQKGKGSVRTIDHFFQVQKHPSGARVSGGPAQVEQTGDSSSGSALSEKVPQGSRRSARIATKEPCSYTQEDSPHDSSVEHEADWSPDLEVAGSQPV